ncbi:MAG: helix-turn-helix domain-containing protein [Thermoguttaceae bacterium]|nr:helix-turn-helix domain-containing protein [Thermoguttaceae bacterium]
MYYSLEKTAEMLDMNTGDVNRLREQGKLRAFRDGGVWKFRKEDVEAFLTKTIKERSASAANDLLSSEDDEEGPTMLADSAAFDSLIEDAAVRVGDQSGLDIKKDDDLKLADDDLKLADDDLKLADDDLKLADDDLKLADDDLKLADDSTPLTDSASALVEDAPSGSATPSSVDLTDDGVKSDDDLLHLGSDSGLSLLDDPDVEGSNIQLGAEKDLVLGGGSSTGSGSGLNLSGDSGLALLGDSDADFQLDESASAPIEDSSKVGEEDEDPDGVFELADDVAAASTPILNLDKNADADAATELAVADDSIFDLAEDTTNGTTTAPDTDTDSDSDSSSSSQLIAVENNPFVVDDSADSSAQASEPAAASDDPFTTNEDSAPAANDPFATGSSVFGGADSSPFGQASAPGFGVASQEVGSVDFGSASEPDPSFVADSASEPIGALGAPVASTNFTGKDMLILVPCLILLILATIGAWELCRTIWSYQEGSFDFAGPVLETLAKLVKLN